MTPARGCGRALRWLGQWFGPVGLDWSTAALLGMWWSSAVSILVTWGIGGPVPVVAGCWVVLAFNLVVAYRERKRARERAALLAMVEADLATLGARLFPEAQRRAERARSSSEEGGAS